MQHLSNHTALLVRFDDREMRFCTVAFQTHRDAETLTEQGTEVGGLTVLDELSCDFSALTMTEKYLLHDPAQPDELSVIINVTGQWLDDVDRGLPKAHQTQGLFITGPLVEAIAHVEAGLKLPAQSLQGLVLEKQAVEDLFRAVAIETKEELKQNPGMPSNMAERFIAAVAITAKIMRHYDFDVTTVLVSND